MENKIFINKTFSNMIEFYLSCRNNPNSINYNSFLNVILNQIVNIYDELDILNPYYTSNEINLYENMEKYGYEKKDLINFFSKLEQFEQYEDKNLFIEIQKMVIDMFINKYKSMDLTEDEIQKFRKKLYSSTSDDPYKISYNYKMAIKSDEIVEYFDYMININVKQEEVKPKELLTFDAYKMLNYSQQDIENMDSDEVDLVNKKVFDYFGINENAINKNYLLNKAIFDINNPTPAYSTGNGFVDILFILAIIATVIMVLIIVTLLIL